MMSLGFDPTPEQYAALERERRKWLRHYLALGCTKRKADELTDRRLQKWRFTTGY